MEPRRAVGADADRAAVGAWQCGGARWCERGDVVVGESGAYARVGRQRSGELVGADLGLLWDAAVGHLGEVDLASCPIGCLAQTANPSSPQTPPRAPHQRTGTASTAATQARRAFAHWISSSPVSGVRAGIGRHLRTGSTPADRPVRARACAPAPNAARRCRGGCRRSTRGMEVPSRLRNGCSVIGSRTVVLACRLSEVDARGSRVSIGPAEGWG